MPVAALCVWRSSRGTRRCTTASPATASPIESKTTRTPKKAVVKMSLPLFRHPPPAAELAYIPANRRATRPRPDVSQPESAVSPSSRERWNDLKIKACWELLPLEPEHEDRRCYKQPLQSR